MTRSLLAACLAVLLPLGAGSAAVASSLEFVGKYIWKTPAAGGLSGLEISEDGSEFIAISDRGSRVDGHILREHGRITGLDALPPVPLRKMDGTPATGNAMDAEGLACRKVEIGADCNVSFEMIHRVVHYDGPDAAAVNRPRPLEFRNLQHNSGLEALAIDSRGRLLAIPERSGALDRPFPVYRLENGRWSVPFSLRREPPFLPVGADFGPDGKLYILERHFTGFAFQSRVRRLTIVDDVITREETLLSTFPFQFDNLEGISVWQDEAGDIRITMISDDNQNIFQKTELVEYRVAP
ncbi:esterase-like activity of phytase family protein [Poseidonocella sp. HB161398]|uniref:esterase-like activity of phytase family protein n=1 Tax=Poseidonocella sp. HB161398 TaxID=2320855 RepID=UPI001109B399|nr:esterase-like activity of phytase family protein [Poseidonocella sp. HB161398]